MNVAVVILNWNGVEHLKTFLPSVVEHSQIPNVNLYVIDNGSTDNSIEFIKTTFPHINLIKLPKNIGFTGGYNQGLQQINTDIFVLLNSDVEVTKNWIAPIVNKMQTDTKIAACQPKILDYKNKTHFEYAGAAGGFMDKYGYPFCRGRVFDTLEKDEGQYNETTEIAWATGACLFVRAKIYNQLNGLDDDFFAHMEEIDLCWRMKNSGYKIICCPESKVYHLGGGTLQKSNPKKTFLNFRNSLFVLVKNLPKNKIISIIFCRLVLDGVAGVKFAFSGELKNTIAIIKAHFSFYANYNKMLKKRNSISNFTPNYCGDFQFSIVFNYFLKKQKTFLELLRK